MNSALLTAALLTLLLAVAHSWLGERYILIRLFRQSELPPLFGGVEFTRNTLRFAWHLTSVVALGFAGLLIALALPGRLEEQIAGQIVAATFALCGLVALIGSKGRHLSWIVFFSIAALTYWVYR